MTENENDELMEFDEPVVVMTDEEGNEYYYREDMIVPVGDKRFAILVPFDVDEEDCDGSCHDASCDCGCGEETDVFIARIDVDESGEEIYVDPTDEEFEEVRKAYEELIDEEEE
ncbi:DUF1292 domain-containing protein [Sporomusa sp. KB1]|jgi:uncharacterized protein YrzB (UPF0473 family)|uniref:DUF1292 domain-containing protein n=1 Tax=Sporomusa sp. KB1 TaxID=943346 RepID=UPI00119E5719|nr:DUF1292 domain-containing protein [Sporomusa sp. KB1]TWH48918.1 uncharacterized protein DUF1292 [Sporomusa sp. KB1]